MSATPSPVRRGRSGLRLVAVLLPGGLLATGCSAREAYESSFSLGFPDPVTKEGESIYALWLGSVAAASVVGLFVTGLIVFAVIRYRRTSDQLPRQVRYNLPIEVLYTAVPFVIIAVLFYYTTISTNVVRDKQEGGADVNIGVVGFQWNWTFRHDDAGVQVTGIPGVQPAVLVLPTDTRIRFTETSPDVIHSFFVPAFLFKQDVVPGRANAFEITITKPGEYIGRCAELCGEKHSAMNFAVKAVSPAQYADYLTTLQADPANAIGTRAGDGGVRTAEEAAELIDGRP
ncbi:MAG: aa3-type cytochrome oxidase subunit II [Mycobacteriales bacterium]